MQSSPDTGIKNACIVAFSNRINSGTAEVFYVRVEEELKVNQRESRVAQWHHYFEEFSGLLYNSAAVLIQKKIHKQMLVPEMQSSL